MPDESLVLGQLVEDFTARVRAGELPDLEEYARQHPALAERIRALFPTLMLLEGMAGGKPGGDGADASSSAPRMAGDILTPGHTFNHYRIDRELGRGGMGVVYEAVHLPLDKRVALKVLPVFAAKGPSQLERFLREARTAAALHHTNVVPVFDIGQANGLPHYAMQFIEGCGLDQILRDLQDGPPGAASALGAPAATGPYVPREETATPARPSRPMSSGSLLLQLGRTGAAEFYRQVAELGIQAAEGLAYAHQRGVIHRDIKPSNLLLDDQGVLWITDFGLARRADDPALTHSGVLVGTPRYMSPEQAEAARRPVDHRTDVYSLGATLYELVARRPAFSGKTPAEVVVQILEREPVSPRRLNPAVPRDLETIILKAMAKRPEDRYQTAAELAADLQRWQRLEPIRARRVGPIGRTVRWCRRNPRLALVSAAYVAIILITSCWYVWKIQNERDQAVGAREQLQDHLCRSNFSEASALVASKGLGHPRQALDLIREAEALRRRDRLAIRASDDSLHSKPLPSRLELRNLAVKALLTPDMKIGRNWAGFLTEVSPNNRWQMVWKVGEQSKVDTRLVDLVTNQEYRTVLWEDPNETVPVNAWDLPVYAFALSSDGKWLVGESKKEGLTLWSLPDGKRSQLQGFSPPAAWPRRYSDFPRSRQWMFTPDGSRLLELREVKKDLCQLMAWDVQTKAPPQLLVTTAREEFDPSCLSPDAKWFAIAIGGQIRLWNLERAEEPKTLPLPEIRQDAEVRCLDVAPNGRLLAAVIENKDERRNSPLGHRHRELPLHQLVIWDLTTFAIVDSLATNMEPQGSLKFSPDSRLLVYHNADRADRDTAPSGTVRFFQALPLRKVLELYDPAGIHISHWHPDGRGLLLQDTKGGSFMHAEPNWHLARSSITTGGRKASTFAFSPNGRWVAVYLLDKRVCQLINRASREVREFKFPEYPDHLHFRVDSAQLGILSRTAWVVVEVPSGKELARGKPAEGTEDNPVSGAFNEAGQFLVVAWDQNHQGTLWNVTNNKLDWRLPKEIPAGGLSRDGRFLVVWPGDFNAAAVLPKHISVWDVLNRSKIKELARERREFVGPYSYPTLSPGKNWLLTPTMSGEFLQPHLALVWSWPSLEKVLKISDTGTRSFPTGRPVYGQSAFSPDDRLLAIADWDGVIQLWDPESGEELFRWKPEPGSHSQLQFAPDGESLVISDDESPDLQVIDLPTLRRQLAEMGLDW
jgi:serine/threonine protein kinase/WD40 repeat protein